MIECVEPVLLQKHPCLIIPVSPPSFSSNFTAATNMEKETFRGKSENGKNSDPTDLKGKHEHFAPLCMCKFSQNQF